MKTAYCLMKEACIEKYGPEKWAEMEAEMCECACETMEGYLRCFADEYAERSEGIGFDLEAAAEKYASSERNREDCLAVILQDM